MSSQRAIPLCAHVHTTTAYHPRNDLHARRLSEGTAPWDSGFLVHPGEQFAVTLTVPGVYDYYCMPHEAAGRIGARRLDYAAVQMAFRRGDARHHVVTHARERRASCHTIRI